MLCERSQTQKGYILNNSSFMTFWKGKATGMEKKSGVARVWQYGGRLIIKEHREFQSMMEFALGHMVARTLCICVVKLPMLILENVQNSEM